MDESAFLLALGQNIRALRMARGLSQEELALRSDIHRTYVSSVERGERNIAILNLRKIARTLGCGLDEVVTIAEHVPPRNRRDPAALARRVPKAAATPRKRAR